MTEQQILVILERLENLKSQCDRMEQKLDEGYNCLNEQKNRISLIEKNCNYLQQFKDEHKKDHKQIEKDTMSNKQAYMLIIFSATIGALFGIVSTIISGAFL